MMPAFGRVIIFADAEACAGIFIFMIIAHDALLRDADAATSTP